MDANITAQLQKYFTDQSKDSHNKETCVMCMEAGYHDKWIKQSRYVTIVKKKEWHAFAVISALKLANNVLMDINVDHIFPVNKELHCDYENSMKPLGGGILMQVRNGDEKYIFEFENSSKARYFWRSVNDLKQITEQQDYLFSDYTWLQKYQESKVKKIYVKDYVESPRLKAKKKKDAEERKSDDLQAAFPFDPEDPFSVPNPANGGIKTMERHSLGTEKELEKTQFRESEQSIMTLLEDLRQSHSDDQRVMYMRMRNRQREYMEVDTRIVFVGTWNVNGKVDDTLSLAEWLKPQDDKIPDIYAIGFQEMDLNLSNVALNKSSPNAIEDKWLRLIESALPKDIKYRRLERCRLAGIFLVVYCNQTVAESVGDVATGSVPTGMFNVLGNKGAVGIRFRWHSSSICFICCHLAAGESEQDLESRNRDYRYIVGRMAFSVDRSTIGMDAHDLIYLFGDLNYRIELDISTVKDLINNKEFTKLHDYDELFREMARKKILQQFEEGQLNFPPSYKFDVNTDIYDTSEKNRTPSYCDRILWRGPSCRALDYGSIMALRISDHKPVAATFEIGVWRIVPHLARRTYEAVIRQMDVLHNLTLPKASLASHSVDFGLVRFMEPRQGSTVLTNDGQSPFIYLFKPCPGGPHGRERLFPPWLTVEPQKGYLEPGQSKELNFEVYINSCTVADFNAGQEKIVDGTLILSLEGGRDLFITCEGKFRPSSFGLPLPTLIRMLEPAASYQLDTITRLCKSSSDDTNPDKANEKDRQPYCFVKELWRLCNHIEKFGLEEPGLFQRPGLHGEIVTICEALDTTPANESKLPLPPCSIHSVTETMLLFLSCMPESIIPPLFNDKLIRASRSTFGEAVQVIKSMPKENRDVFHYLILFMKRVLEFRKKNETSVFVLASVFVEVMTQNIPSERRSEKINFLQLFLENDNKDLGY